MEPLTDSQLGWQLWVTWGLTLATGISRGLGVFSWVSDLNLWDLTLSLVSELI